MAGKPKQPIPGIPCCPLYVDDAKANQCANASRFQRFFIALSCILAVVTNNPHFLYPVLISLSILLCTSSIYDPSILFYKHILAKTIGRYIRPIAPEESKKYILGNSVEKFVFSVILSFILFSLFLHHHHYGCWFMPVAIVATGISFAATTGFCTMAVLYNKTRSFMIGHT